VKGPNAARPVLYHKVPASPLRDAHVAITEVCSRCPQADGSRHGIRCGIYDSGPIRFGKVRWSSHAGVDSIDDMRCAASLKFLVCA